MRLREDMEEFIRSRKRHVATDADTDKRILDDSFGAMEAAKAELTGGRPNLRSVLLASRVTRLAAAAVVIVLIGFVIVHQAARRQIDGQTFTDAAKSPGEMMTVLSLNIAYRQGGMDAVEKQYEKAFKILGPRLTSISVQDLLAECNRNWKGQNYENN